ncbi:hypothetical protein O6H91_01G009400 [Diphasiastrum complanatum]|uniref:Uncharacterized protein n=2 Tax=Diphasiastrum complanatum TaxID=34168 RepID=A0ACC2EMX1_DIPCM|nr:hypothetical protein O6H91_01G009400 [Diphasiastrum complanatum]
MAQIANVFVIFMIILVAYDVDAAKQKRPKSIALEFYMHDIVQTANATTALVAGPNGDTKTINSFGSVMVIDDPLTEGPELGSRLVGRGQGMYVFDSMNDFSLLLSFTAVFVKEKHNGTLSFHGADRILLTKREIPVVGGTGDFRFAQGYAFIETASIKGFSAVLKFSVTVVL